MAAYIEIDASDVLDEIHRMQAHMSEKQFNQAMFGIFRRTAKHVGVILKQDVPPHYEVKKKEVGEVVKKPQLSTGFSGVGCVIPLTGPQKSIGGSGTGFKASGGVHGWPRRKYRVRARIVKGQVSVLPEVYKGTHAPFRNIGARRLNNVAFARTGSKALPIQKIAGIAVPQMPMTRARPEVERDLHDFLVRQVDARLNQMLRSGR